MEAETLVGRVEECFRQPVVGPRDGQRPSTGHTKLILLEWRYLGKKWVPRVEIGVSHELPKGAVILVRSRLRDHIDDATQRAAVGGVVVVGLDLELLNVIDDRGNGIGAP